MTLIPVVMEIRQMMNSYSQTQRPSDEKGINEFTKRNYYQNKFPSVIYKTLTMNSAIETVSLVTQELETQSLNAIVAGFSFAAALSWNDLVRWVIQQLIKVPKNSGSQYTLSAVLTTLLSIVVYLIVSGISKRVTRPAQPVYAITQ